MAPIPASAIAPVKTCPQTRFIGHPPSWCAAAHSCGAPVAPDKGYRPGGQSAKNVATIPSARRQAPSTAPFRAARPTRSTCDCPRSRDDRQSHGVALALLVARHEGPRRPRAPPGSTFVGRPSAAKRAAARSTRPARRPPKGGRCAHLGDRPERDGLAVKPARVAAVRLERVAHRVPEVQERPRSRSRARRRARRESSPRWRRARSGGERRPARLAPARGRRARAASRSERVRRERDLHDLGEARGPLARRQRRRGAPRSATTALGWWNAPMRFLPDGVIEAGLSADRRVDHREQRRRHLDEAHAAQQARRREPREVADDPAAGRDDERVAIDARRRAPRPRSVLTLARVLCDSPGGSVTRVDADRQRPQRGVDRAPRAPLHVRVGHEDDRRRREPRDRVGQPGGVVDAHVDRVAARPEGHDQRIALERARRRRRPPRSGSSASVDSVRWHSA